MSNVPGLDEYLNDINPYRVLNEQETRILGKRIQDGDHEALEELVNHNLRFVVKLAYEFIDKQIPKTLLMDLIQEGNIGLNNAAKKWDYRKNVSFTSYASFYIKGSMRECINTNLRSVRLPVSVIQDIKKIKDVSESFYEEHFKAPTLEELLPLLPQFSLEKIRKLYGYNQYNFEKSLDEPLNEDDTTLYDQIGIEDEQSEIISKESYKEKIMNVLGQLPAEDQIIIKMCTGKCQDEDIDVRKISKESGQNLKQVLKAISKAKALLKASTNKLDED